MSAVVPTQPTATLDDFLADPIVWSEFAAVLERLMGDLDHSLRIKCKEDRWEPKRIRLDGQHAAAVILKEWREFRP